MDATQCPHNSQKYRIYFFFNFSQCTKIYKDCVAKMADPKDRKGRMACGKLYLECAFKPEEMKCAKKVIYVEYFTLRNF